MSGQYDNTRFVKGLVSIVTPVYNGEHYIHRLLESVLAQDYLQIEMILSDDGSDDGTVAAAESYRDRFNAKGHLFKVITGEHINASGAVCRGLKAVTGEYLIWPDGDDELTPDSVAKRVEYLKTHPEYQCVRTLADYVDDRTGEAVEAVERIGDLTVRRLFRDILFGYTFVCCGCYMLKSERFFEIYPNREIPIYDVGQNFQMLLPYMYHYECPTLQDRCYIVHRREDSHSKRILSQQEDYRKYLLYEALIDDIVGVIGIMNRNEIRMVEYWKADREKEIALRYSDMQKYKMAYRRMLKIGGRYSCKALGHYAKRFIHRFVFFKK